VTFTLPMASGPADAAPMASSAAADDTAPMNADDPLLLDEGERLGEAGDEGEGEYVYEPGEMAVLSHRLSTLSVDTYDDAESSARRPSGPRPPLTLATEAPPPRTDAERSAAIADLHKYQIVGKVDDGSYGEVFEARDLRHGDRVAIKRIRMTTQHTLPQDVIREIATLTRLGSHPLVVDLKKVFVFESDVHLVLAFHETTLHDLAESMDMTDVRNYSFQLLTVVDHLWQEGLLHRDIKPENILIGRHGLLRLADFGHSTRRLGTWHLSSDHVGTRDYRAPELMLATSDYDVRAEVWAVACTCYFMYTGRHLFDSQTDEELLRIWMQHFTFSAADWPELPTYRRYDRFSLILRRRTYRRGVNVIAKLLSNKDKRSTWSTDPCLRNFTALLHVMLMPNPANRPLPAALLEHDYFAGVWREYLNADTSKQLQGMRQARQWNPRASLNTANLKGMEFYTDDATRSPHFRHLRAAFQRIVRTAEEKYPIALEILLDGLDVLDHFVADSGESLPRVLAVFPDPNTGYLGITFACIFLVFKYYEDRYHDLAQELEEEEASEPHSAEETIGGDPDSSAAPMEATEAVAVEPTAEPVVAPTEGVPPAEAAEEEEAEEEEEEEDGGESGWETGSTVASSSPASSSSHGSHRRGRHGRIDDVSDTVGIRLRDVLVCEKAVLDTIGLQFLNRPTAHRLLVAGLGIDEARVRAGHVLALLALQDPLLAARGLQAVAHLVVSALDGTPLPDTIPVLAGLFSAEVLPHSIAGDAALRVVTAALMIEIPDSDSPNTSA